MGIIVQPAKSWKKCSAVALLVCKNRNAVMTKRKRLHAIATGTVEITTTAFCHVGRSTT